MESKGYRRVDVSEADLAVGYQVTSEEQTSYQTVSTGWGGGYGRWRRGRGWGGGIATSTTTERSYTVGTLILAVFDPQREELVWQAVAEGKLEDGRDPEESQAVIDETIAEILSDFPPQ
jgi:hypothetical protein